MRPLDPLAELSVIARLLKSAPAAEVRAEITRLEGMALTGAAGAATRFAKGALSLREGALDVAHQSLIDAKDAFERLGETQAGRLCDCEARLVTIRRGPRAVYSEAIAALSAIADEAREDTLVVVVATHYRGTGERFLGDVEATQRTLLNAFRKSEPFLDERAKILNSLGTLYVLLGAFGAAQALLEHAAELHHQHGDAVGEAIACGQLGSAALALGDLERARKYLQKQEWFASKVGDSFGQARALTFLADVALELGRPDDAATLAGSARSIAQAVTPPLKMWIAYALRASGRAKIEMGDPGAHEDLTQAADLFRQIGNPLGAALTQWDEARLHTQRGKPAPSQAKGDWFAPAWTLGSLGLTARVAQLLQEHHALCHDTAAPDRQTEQALAVAAQGLPHLAATQEIDLVYSDPDGLAVIAARRTAAQRNLGRLAALTIAPPGLWVAVIFAPALGSESAGGQSAQARPNLPGERTAAAAVTELPGMTAWVWPVGTALSVVARDLATARASLGEATRVALGRAPLGRVLSPPFAGEVGAALYAVDLASLLVWMGALEAGTLLVGNDIQWPAEADAIASAAGYAVRIR